MSTIKHLELFSGIGGFRKAFEFLEHDFSLNVKSVGFSEIDQYAIKTYKANFDTSDEIEMGDIVGFTQEKAKLSCLPDFDFLTGGFPCQSFSLMGHKKGFDDLRGNVFFQIIDILKIKKPPYILLENVRNLISHNKGETFKTVLKFIENVGYESIYYDIFNTSNFGLAQKRNRVYIFATAKAMPKNFKFCESLIKSHFKTIFHKTSLLKQNTVFDVLEKEVDCKYYLSDVIKPTILSCGSKKFKSKSEINPIVARPLTATMVKMHRACQDNYFSDDFINCNDCEAYELQRNVPNEVLLKKRIRKLTPKEAFMLQGFDNDFVKNAIASGVSNHQLYKQAGNAVSVNTVYAIFHYILSAINIL